jgi:hypothetical protein
MLAAIVMLAVATASLAAEPAWVTESNANSQALLDVMAKYSPESAAAFGVEGHDQDILDLRPGNDTRLEADLDRVSRALEVTVATTTDPRVRQDLQILIEAARDQQATSALDRRLLLPYFDLTSVLYQSFQRRPRPLPGRAGATAQVRRSRTGIRADHPARPRALRRALRDSRPDRSLDR